MVMIILVLEIFCRWRFLRSFLAVYIVTVFFIVKRSARSLQLISVKVSSMSSVLGLLIGDFCWNLNHCCIPLEVSRIPNLPRQVSTTSHSSILNILFLLWSQTKSHHTRTEVHNVRSTSLLRYWLLSLSLLFTHWQLYFYLSVIYLRRCWRGKKENWDLLIFSAGNWNFHVFHHCEW